MHASQLELRENNCITFSDTKYLKCNENMPNMIPIAYVNAMLMDCNENLAWGKQEHLIHPYMFWYTKKERKWQKPHFAFFLCRYHNF